MNRRLLDEARLWLVAIPVLLWTLIPIYHIFLFSISTKDSAFSGRLWPEHPTLRNFGTVMNAALFTYFIPAAFLAVPMYKAMGTYGLLNSRWSLVLAMVTIAAPYAIWVLKQASDKLPWELDEAARIDG